MNSKDLKNLAEERDAAAAKVRMWAERAQVATIEGRAADAKRCHDKVRDWRSRLGQFQRRLLDGNDVPMSP